MREKSSKRGAGGMYINMWKNNKNVGSTPLPPPPPPIGTLS